MNKQAISADRMEREVMRDGNTELSVAPHHHHLPIEDTQRVAITLSARKDVFSATVGQDNYLHVRYNAGNLRGAAREALILQMKRTILGVIDHKLAHPGAGSTRRTMRSAVNV